MNTVTLIHIDQKQNQGWEWNVNAEPANEIYNVCGELLVEDKMPPLWAHQAKAVELSQYVNELGLFFEVGTGKSRTAIDILRWRCAAHKRLLRTLILAPKIVLLNWKREVTKYSKIHPWDVVILQNNGKRRLIDFKEAVIENHALTKGKIIVTNYEALQMEELFQALMDWKPEVIIADEAHKLKNPESVRAKKCIQLADQSLYRYALSGSPIPNSAMDVFNVFRFLDGGRTFGRNFWRFRSDWFEDANARWAGNDGYFPKYEPRPETYQEFHKRIYTKAIRAVKSECLDLPPFVRKEVFVEMGTEQKKLYETMKRDYIAFIDEQTDQPRAVVAQMAVVKAIRLQQIVTGFAKTEDGDIHKIEKNPRIDALKELLEDLAPEHKIIVWSVFHENYADIAKVCKALKVGFTELHGKIASKVRDQNIDRFNNDPSCRVLIGNPAAGGIGINLVSSSVAIFYSKNFSLVDDIQAEGRNYRGGSERHSSITRIDLVAPGTIDELVNDALARKQEISKTILDWKDKL